MSTAAEPAITAHEPVSATALPQELIDRIAQGSVERDLTRTLPFEQIAWLDEARFGAIRVPREYGGPGGTVEDLVKEVIRLAEADSNIAHLYRGHFGFVDALAFKSDEQKKYWYAKVLEGKTVGNASTEKGGNALGTLNTVLHRNDAGKWLLNGEKFYSTGTIFSDYTRASASIKGEDGRCFAVVPTDGSGVTVHDDWDGFGQKLTGTGTTEFNDVAVDEISVFDRVAGSHEAVHEAAFFQLYLLAAQVGIAKAAVRDASATLAKRTRTFNTSASGAAFKQDPLIQQIIGRMSSKTFVAESAVLEVARIHDQALEATGEGIYASEIAVEKAQITVPDLVLQVTQELFQTVGASATLRTKALDRHWRNAQTIATHNPIVFRARAIGDYEINGTLPEGLNAIGEAKK
ncbi:acyl-CoA dehydrogenase family protein [Nesterenkonia muleiensis]|uniref:acyl-CoA dehydrogenase family protein n=1 Tax=Nesterenkonia muleiensis TaxID=2282648 RepID=UPI000E71D489|nr:acyl-CoA dehydrogenase family protein [Nesterenkonia muleiensis]